MIDQSAFVNVSIFDREYVYGLFGGMEYPDGSFLVDEVDEFIEHEKWFMETVSDIRSDNLFTFPILTYSLLKRSDISEEEAAKMIKNKDWNVFVDNDFARWCSDHNTVWNDSNFFMSSDVNTLSNCCRLLSDTSKLSAFINSVGGTALSIGSCVVNTINLMRIYYESAGDPDKFLDILWDKTLLCCQVLDRVRWIIKRNIDKGLLPNYSEGGVEMEKQYNTIGILALWEAVEAFGYIRYDEFENVYYTDEGIEFASKIFDVLNGVKDQFFELDKNLEKTNEFDFTEPYSFNIESVPGERAAVILCQKDNLLYGGSDKFIYANQWIPLSYKCTIQEKLRVSNILDNKCSGGSIAHINVESNFPDKDSAWEMLNKIALTGVIYFAFNSRINECKNHHGFVGTDICPVCGNPVFDTYQRIVGYLVPKRAYSKDRMREFSSRRWYNYATELKDL